MFTRLRRLRALDHAAGRLLPGLLWGALWPVCASAQEPAWPDAGEASGVVVIPIEGGRISLETAQANKARRLEIVDSVVAEDMGKLPDSSVTEAIQRVTGVQVQRDRGEGSGLAVRGLTQLETTLDGREAFTAGTGRTLELVDLPAEMLAGIDVYKTASADQIEGGIGAVVDLRTRRPFDYEGAAATASARWVYGDLAGRGAGQYSALLSNRWHTEGAGELGLLLNAVSQNRAWREDQKLTGNPVARTDILAGETVLVPNGSSETTSVGDRKRDAGSLRLQWRPDPHLTFHAEAGLEELRTLQDSYQFNAYPSASFVAGSPVLFPEGNTVQSITWTDAPVSVLSFVRDTLDRNRQAAVGGSWRDGGLSLSADLSYADSRNELYFSGLALTTTAAGFSQDLAGSTPATAVVGTDLLDPANYQYTNIIYREWAYDGSARALRIDGSYAPDGGLVETLKAGLRVSERSAGNNLGVIIADTSLGGVAAGSMPGLITPNPYSDFLPGSTSVGAYLVGDISSARDPNAYWDAFGIANPPSGQNPLGPWRIDETTEALYLMAELVAVNPSVDGNLGLRVVRTREQVEGKQSVPDSGTVAPIARDSEYLDYLPSLNLRYKPRDGLNLRLSLSRTLSRPNFDQLSPSLTLIRNSIDPSQNQGGAGNVDLEPVRSDNLDLAIERYFRAGGLLSLTGFLKNVDGFVTTVSAPELHYGEVYQVSRPQNAHGGKVNGFELGYQQFYPFLPGWMSGLGLQANYTRVESETVSPLLGANIPLQNFSRDSYNLTALYERGGVSARLGYNWRSRYLSGVANVVGVGPLPVYTRGYGWLDAALGFRLGARATLWLEGSNLLGTRRSSYYGEGIHPQSVWLNDRQYAVRLSAEL